MSYLKLISLISSSHVALTHVVQLNTFISVHRLPLFRTVIAYSARGINIITNFVFKCGRIYADFIQSKSVQYIALERQ